MNEKEQLKQNFYDIWVLYSILSNPYTDISVREDGLNALDNIGNFLHKQILPIEWEEERKEQEERRKGTRIKDEKPGIKRA